MKISYDAQSETFKAYQYSPDQGKVVLVDSDTNFEDLAKRNEFLVSREDSDEGEDELE